MRYALGAAMITRVSIGQVRFNLPGLTADARGVAVGKELLLRFATLERLVSFLRLLSGERTSEEIWGQMRVLHARPGGGTREVFVRLANPMVEATDQIAATARLAGGAVFTGSGRHFVPARDARGPLGYDTSAIAEDDGDFTLYTDEGRTTFRQEGDLSLERLLLRLELRRHPGGALAHARAARGGPVYVAARRGLALPLIDRLFAGGVDGQAAICEGGRPSPFATTPGFWLLRLPELPPRLHGLCARTPGLTLYLPVLDDVLVAAGWEHPIHLGSCRAALRGERLLLLPPPPAAVVEISPRPGFVALGDLVKIRPATSEEPRASAVPAVSDPLVVPLRLEAVADGPPRPRAVLVPWAQSGWFRRLLFALPASALRSYRVAFLELGVLVLASDRLEGIPFGQLLEELIPGALVPVGTRLRPALSPDLLAERLGISEGSLCVFPAPGAPPFRVAREAFEPLERRALARTDVPWGTPAGSARTLTLGGSSDNPPEIENDPLGMLPLWGFRP
jgi:hypothetical protein